MARKQFYNVFPPVLRRATSVFYDTGKNEKSPSSEGIEGQLKDGTARPRSILSIKPSIVIFPTPPWNLALEEIPLCSFQIPFAAAAEHQHAVIDAPFSVLVSFTRIFCEFFSGCMRGGGGFM